MLLSELREFIRHELRMMVEGHVPRHGLSPVDMRELMSDAVLAKREARDSEIEKMRVEQEKREGRRLTPGELSALGRQWDAEYEKTVPSVVQKLKELEPKYRMEAEKRSQAFASSTGRQPSDQDTVVVPFPGHTFGLERFFVPSNKPEGPKYIMVSRLVKLTSNDGFVMAKDSSGQWKWHWAPPQNVSGGELGIPDWIERGERGIQPSQKIQDRRAARVQDKRDAAAPPVIRRRRDEETGEVTGHTPVRTAGRRPTPPKEIIDDYTGYAIGHRDPKTGRLVRPDNWAEIQQKIKNSR